MKTTTSTFTTLIGGVETWIVESVKEVIDSNGEVLCPQGGMAALRVKHLGVNSKGQKIYDACLPLDYEFSRSVDMRNITARELLKSFKKIR